MRQLFCGRAQSRERHPPGFCDYELRPSALRWRFGCTHLAPFIRRSRCRQQRRCASRSRRPKRDRFRIPSAPSNKRSRLRIFNNKGMIADIDCAHEPNPSIIPQELHGGRTGAAREPHGSRMSLHLEAQFEARLPGLGTPIRIMTQHDAAVFIRRWTIREKNPALRVLLRDMERANSSVTITSAVQELKQVLASRGLLGRVGFA